MSSNKRKNFSPEAINLLAHMMNMTLNTAEQLSRRNQLATENPPSNEMRTDESCEMTIAAKTTSLESNSSSSALEPSFLRSRPSADNNQGSFLRRHALEPTTAEGEAKDIRVDMLSKDDATGDKKDKSPKSIAIQVTRDCPSVKFYYSVSARRNAKDICLPAQVTVTQLREPGVEICFHVDTQHHSELPPLDVHILCPNYEPKQVWLNGQKCTH